MSNDGMTNAGRGFCVPPSFVIRHSSFAAGASRLALLPLLLWISCPSLSAAPFSGRLVVEDFESFTWGGEWATLQFSDGADPRMTRTRDPVRSGRFACELVVPPGESLVLITQHGLRFTGKGDKPAFPLPGRPERVGLWVFGAHSGHTLWLQILDSQGKTADLALGPVDFEGWRFLEAKLPPLSGPVGLRGLSVRGGTGRLVIDDITVATSAEDPLFVDARPASPDTEFVAGERAEFRVVVQSVGAVPIGGEGEVVACERGSQTVAARQRFSFRAAPGQPYVGAVRLRLPAGVLDLVVRAGEAESRRRVVVYPGLPRVSPLPKVPYLREVMRFLGLTSRRCHSRIAFGRAPVSPRAIRSFGERGDALRVYESALSPALLVETRSDTLTLFRALPAVGLSGPQDGIVRTESPLARAGDIVRADLAHGKVAEPWLLLWFGGAPAWDGVKFADGSPCPGFDVPFLVVFEHRPVKVELREENFTVHFDGPAGRAALMPLFGIHRQAPRDPSRWKEDPALLGALTEQCRFWVGALRALPIDVAEEWQVDAARDEVEFRARFTYLETPSTWGPRPLHVAPVPPLLTLAREAGLPVRVSPEPRQTTCDTSLGPYTVVSGSDEVRYAIHGLLRYVNKAVADLPAGHPEVPVSLARAYWALATDAPKIPYWTRQAGDRGRLATEALLRWMLWPENCRYEWDAAHGRLRALDGLAWQEQGEEQAAAATAELLRAGWHAGFDARLWDVLEPHWHHLESLRSTLDRGEWATLGLGPTDADAQLNAEVFFARLAARLGWREAYGAASARAAKLLIAMYALAAGAPAFTREHKPLPNVGADGQPLFFTICRPGSLGFAPGPPVFVTSPSDAGYNFARDRLTGYFRQNFRPGPLGFYGRTPNEWAERKMADIEAYALDARFRPCSPPVGEFRGNYVYSVKPGPDGWPSLAWESHQAPAGGPLLFGSIGTGPSTRGVLRRTVTVSPYLRLSAYEAIEVPPAPKEPESPKPPAPKKPPAPRAGGRPAQSRP